MWHETLHDKLLPAQVVEGAPVLLEDAHVQQSLAHHFDGQAMQVLPLHAGTDLVQYRQLRIQHRLVEFGLVLRELAYKHSQQNEQKQ